MQEVTYEQFVDHVEEYNQEMKCTVNEISQLKDRISSLENEIKTLKLSLFLWLVNSIMIVTTCEVGPN